MKPFYNFKSDRRTSSRRDCFTSFIYEWHAKIPFPSHSRTTIKSISVCTVGESIQAAEYPMLAVCAARSLCECDRNGFVCLKCKLFQFICGVFTLAFIVRHIDAHTLGGMQRSRSDGRFWHLIFVPDNENFGNYDAKSTKPWPPVVKLNVAEKTKQLHHHL